MAVLLKVPVVENASRARWRGSPSQQPLAAGWSSALWTLVLLQLRKLSVIQNADTSCFGTFNRDTGFCVSPRLGASLGPGGTWGSDSSCISLSLQVNLLPANSSAGAFLAW